MNLGILELIADYNLLKQSKGVDGYVIKMYQ